ncbi:hypothetical protein Tco_0939451 [Tanacetum coccineum]|uniref:Uncharacterized protein n=1 Tax=Tanacetum coccineum TaxID=301880 RepID=A0ABQ5DMU1_9ASTR
MGCCLTSWFSKKQTAFSISTAEAEYVSVEKACQQALWMKQALVDYDVRLDDNPIMCDNKGAIDLSDFRQGMLSIGEVRMRDKSYNQEFVSRSEVEIAVERRMRSLVELLRNVVSCASQNKYSNRVVTVQKFSGLSRCAALMIRALRIYVRAWTEPRLYVTVAMEAVNWVHDLIGT